MTLHDPAQHDPVRHDPVTADVTVVMPARNRAGLIGRALESVARQTVAPAEVVVVDDASSDGTADVARRHGATVLVQAEAGGSGPARNVAVAHAATRWVAFLDSDDEWQPRHLELLLAVAGDDVLVTAPATRDDGRVIGNPWRRPVPLTPPRLLAPSDLVVTSGTMALRATVLEVGGFRALPRAQDLDLWLRVLEVGSGTALGHPTVLYHEHGEQASKDEDLMRRSFDDIVATYGSRSWYTPLLAQRSRSRLEWDDLRRAQRERRWGDVGTHLGWFVRHPRAVPALVEILRHRRQGRTAG